jgi:hypothetical protein
MMESKAVVAEYDGQATQRRINCFIVAKAA